MKWVWMNGGAYLVRDGMHNDYIAFACPDDVTPDMAAFRVYAGRERAAKAQSIEAVAVVVRSILNRDDIPALTR